MSEIPKNIQDKIIEIVGEDRMRTSILERRMYSHDLASLPKMMELGFKMMPDMVVRPSSAEEVSEIIKLAARESIPIVPRGGASWGLGGAMPIEGGIVLDITAMNGIEEIDEDNLNVRCGAGITWQELYNKMLEKGFLIGSYPSSAFAATVGGWINTGGVGVGSYKYGSAMDQLMSMEVVLPTGTIIETGSKNIGNFKGHDLNRVFFGAEGTLGIITKVTLRLQPGPEEIRPLSYTFGGMKDLSKAVNSITRSEVIPLHISFLDARHFDFLREIGLVEESHKSKAVLNVTMEGDREVINIQEKAVDNMMEGASGNKLAKDEASHEWSERFYELRTKRAGPSAILGEAFVPVSAMSDMSDSIYKLIKKMKLRAAITGLVADRNTVLFMPYYLTDERKMIKSMMSLSFVKKLGDISYKHGGRPLGMGLFFTGNLKRMYGPGYDVMIDLKDIMDPYYVMNPGKTTEGLTKYGVPIPTIAYSMGMNVMSFGKGILPKDKMPKDKKVKS